MLKVLSESKKPQMILTSVIPPKSAYTFQGKLWLPLSLFDWCFETELSFEMKVWKQYLAFSGRNKNSSDFSHRYV